VAENWPGGGAAPVRADGGERRSGPFVAGVCPYDGGPLLAWDAFSPSMCRSKEKDHELVERGPFRVLRHPLQRGAYGVLASLCASKLACFVREFCCDITAAFIHRMNVEERALADARRALSRLHEAHQNAGAVCLLNGRKTGATLDSSLAQSMRYLGQGGAAWQKRAV